MKKMERSEVQLYLYDMALELEQESGLLFPKKKLWHSSVVVFGNEYSFGSGGITVDVPDPTSSVYNKKVMGTTTVKKHELDKFIHRLKTTWTSSSYDVVHKNCHNFSQLLLQYLDVSDLSEKVSYVPRKIYKLGFRLLVETVFINAYGQIKKFSRSPSEEKQPGSLELSAVDENHNKEDVRK